RARSARLAARPRLVFRRLIACRCPWKFAFGPTLRSNPAARKGVALPDRVVIVAEPKMLHALAAGLREGGRFEVATAGTPDEAKALLAHPARAVVVFYGSQQWPMPGALQSLGTAREPGPAPVAVLRKAQAA